MISIGLTGNVASGKTTVADRWSEAGVRVIDADRLGHAVLAEDGAAREALVEAFGEGILTAGGSIDRAALGERAFADDDGVRRLNAIVHPPLLERLRSELERAALSGEPLAVVDAALVFEFGMDDDLDAVVLVTAPPELRADRLRKSRGLDDERIARLMAAQIPDAEKEDRSDYVVVNDGSIEDLEAAADRTLARIRADFALDDPTPHAKENDHA
ncbi:MAG TPA: dephospho-CoA kinase [Gemmatimonadota bacterium]|nr:dephospho-CoA kinase [Gemmatimonadota bacterium]